MDLLSYKEEEVLLVFTKELCQFICRTNYEDIPPDVIAVAKKAILDYIAVTMSGSQEPSGRIMGEMVKETNSPEEATVIGLRFKTNAALAALANGTSAHTQDYDDCLDYPKAGLAHPTAGTFSGVLTIGEKNHLSGKELITAYCLGVEAYGKTGQLLIRSGGAGSRGWEWTGTLGVIGSTIALSKMLKLNETQMINALGIASTMACSLIRNFGSFAGHIHGGNGARNGIEAVTLALKGYDCTGADVIEGRGGYYNAFADNPEIPLSEEEQKEKIAMLGNPWSLVNPSLMFKYYPCAHISHFGVWAGQMLHKKYDFDWHNIAAIEFRQPKMLARNTTPPPPENGVQGRFSMAYCLCRSLIHDGVDFWMFKDDTVKDPDTLSLMDKLTFSVIEQEEGKLVFGYQEVVLKMKDGSELKYKIDHPKGEPQNPQSPEELEAKFRKCAAYAGYTEPTVTQIRDMVANFENIKDITELTALLAK
jgi:2-methylcitrate dehydratase PrpD